jgi:type I restriction enzyme S subunit
MNDVKLQRLDEISDVIDSLHQTPSYVDNGLPMVRVTDIKGGSINLKKTFRVTAQVFKEFTKKYEPKKGDILMTRVGSYGTCSYVDTDEQFCLGQNTVVIKPKINTEFLYYSLIASNIKGQIESFVTGSTQKTISLKNIRSLSIPVPIEEDVLVDIAKTLSNLDRKIDLNNKINTELEAMAKLIYDYWFVQFDFPSDSPENKGKPYKSSGGKMVYNEELKREIPEG